MVIFFFGGGGAGISFNWQSVFLLMLKKDRSDIEDMEKNWLSIKRNPPPPPPPKKKKSP